MRAYLQTIQITTLVMAMFVSTTNMVLAACAPGIPCVSYTNLNDTDNAAKKGNASTCDANFMNQIYAKAFIEAQRENIYNQIYIRKAESTLQYSCFDDFMTTAGSQAAPLFSENPRWENKDEDLWIVCDDCPDKAPLDATLDSGSLQDSIDSTVKSSANAYLSTNFNHSAGGGSLIPSGTCMSMGGVWYAAKCENLPAPSDLFFAFSELTTGDPRVLPSTCPAGTTGITSDHIKIAENKGPSFPAFLRENIDQSDRIFFQISGITNPEHGPAPHFYSPCGFPVPTGLKLKYTITNEQPPTPTNRTGITTKTYININEKHCSNPGCYYNFATDECIPG